VDALDDVSNAATKAALSVAQDILMNMLTGSHLSSAKAAELEGFNWSRDKTEQFIWSIHITVTKQLDTFADKRMKILYALINSQRDGTGLG